MTHSPDPEKISRQHFLKKLGALSVFTLLPKFSWAQSTESQSVEIPFRGDSLDAPKDYVQPTRESPFILRGPRDNKRIALTFDDGPTPGVTEKVLQALSQSRARSTFFMIGNRVKQSPNLAREVKAQGHEIGNHSYTHPVLSHLSAETVKQELEKTQNIIAETTGVTSHWFRPPYGAFKASQAPIAAALKLNIVIWSVDPRDWSRPGINVIQRRVVNQTSGGDIVLCHDLHRQTGDAAPYMIASLVDRGFELVTLSELLLG